MVVTDDDEVAAAQMRLLRSHGMTTLTWDRHRGHASGYDVVELGFNYRIDEPRGGAGPSPPGAPGRRERAPRASSTRATESCSPASMGVAPALRPAADAQLAHHLFTVVLDDGTRPRRASARALAAARHPDERALPARSPFLDLRRGAATCR